MNTPTPIVLLCVNFFLTLPPPQIYQNTRRAHYTDPSHFPSDKKKQRRIRTTPVSGSSPAARARPAPSPVIRSRTGRPRTKNTSRGKCPVLIFLKTDLTQNKILYISFFVCVFSARTLYGLWGQQRFPPYTHPHSLQQTNLTIHTQDPNELHRNHNLQILCFISP